MPTEPIDAASIRRLSAVYVAYVAVRRAAFDKGVLAIFLVAQGLTSGEVGMLQTVLFVTTMATELPTGMLGDRYGRRLSVFLGLVCTALYCAGMMVAAGVWQFVLLFVVMGIGRSFVSGSDHALLYDALKAGGENTNFLKVEARARAVGGLSLSLAMATGGLIAEISWTMLFALYLATTFASMAIWAAFSLSRAGKAGDRFPEQPDGKRTRTDTKLMRFLLTTRKGQSFSLAVIGMALLGAIVAPFYFFAQTAMIDLGLDIKVVGFLYGSIELVASGVILLASRIERELTFPVIGTAFCLIVALAFFAAAAGTLTALIAGFMLIVVVSPIFDAVALHFLHRKTPSDIRASALSAASLVLTCLIGGGFWAYGAIVDALGRDQAFAIAGLTSLAVLVVLAALTRGGALLRPYIPGHIQTGGK